MREGGIYKGYLIKIEKKKLDLIVVGVMCKNSILSLWS